MIKRRVLSFLAFLFSTFLSTCVLAQAGGTVNAVAPLTRDLGALVKLSAQGTGTVNSSDQTGFNITRIICVFNQASHTGTPSSTFAIQNKDAASGAYYTLVTSAAITTDTTPTYLAVGDVATAANVALSVPVARTWRVTTTVGGTTPTVTGTIGCSVQ